MMETDSHVSHFAHIYTYEFLLLVSAGFENDQIMLSGVDADYYYNTISWCRVTDKLGRCDER